MLKKTFSVMVILFSLVAKGQNISIADAAFKKALLENTEVNTDKDQNITYQEAAAFSGHLNVSNLGISSLEEIQAFTNLKSLDCSSNNLNYLQLNKNTKLEILICRTKVNNLVIDQCTLLKELYLASSAISLNVSKNTNLKILEIDYFGQLYTLDLSLNLNLEKINIRNCNQLQTINLPKTSKLTYLFCSYAKLTTIDLSPYPDLRYLEIWSPLTNIDLSYNPLLTHLAINSTKIQNFDFSKNKMLTYLSCAYNSLITSLNINQNHAIDTLFCESNANLQTLDLSNNTYLKYIYCGGISKLTTLDLSKNAALTYFDCTGSNFSTIDLTHNPELIDISCAYTKLTALDVSKNAKLITLNCTYGYIKSLDLSHNFALTNANCANNLIENLYLGKISAINNLNANRNIFPALDLSLQNIKYLSVDRNKYLKEICTPLVFDTTFWSKDATAIYRTDCTPIVGYNDNLNNKPYNDISIYPNPAVNSVTIKGSGFGNAQISIHSLKGDSIYMYQYDEVSDDKISIYTEGFPAGIYIISIRTEKEVLKKRLIID